MKIAQEGFGTIPAPDWLSNFGGGDVNGLQVLLSIVLRTLIVVAGIYTVLSIILAGFAFISASGDPKKIQDATAKIWQSLLGLTVAAGAFVIAGVLGQIIFNDPDALLQLRYFSP